jgi:citrate lyase beta subunit
VDQAVDAGADTVIVDLEDAVAFGAAECALGLGIEMTRQGEELTYPLRLNPATPNQIG